ncbi:MAG: helix-turn-helix transcriptional regulator [bacterium]
MKEKGRSFNRGYNKVILTRIFKIFQKIRDLNYPSLDRLLEEISFEVGKVSKRTIKRDIATLKYDLNLPIEYDRARGGYYLAEKCEFPFPPLSGGEVISLLIATNLLQQFKGTPLEKSLSSLEKKIEFLLSDKISINPKELEMALSVNMAYIKLKTDISDIFDKIFKAIREKYRVLVRYHSLSSNETKERKIDPYHIYNFQGVWYFCGYCHLRKEIRDFALDRITSIKILNEKFEFQKDFNLKDYLNRAFRIYKGDTQKIRIWFDSYQARWIKERIWHESQEIEELENGEIVLTIEGNIEEIKRWVMSYGSHCKVLEPESLKKEIEEEVKKLSKLYNTEIGLLRS